MCFLYIFFFVLKRIKTILKTIWNNIIIKNILIKNWFLKNLTLKIDLKSIQEWNRDKF